MIVIVNGESRETDGEKPLGELLEELKRPASFAVAINRKVVPVSRWDKEIVHEGDHIELICATKET